MNEQEPKDHDDAGIPRAKQPEDCSHEEFEAQVDVNRLTDKEGGGVSNFAADIRIRCVQCGSPMHFIGVDQGLSFRRPMASADGLELRAPLGIGSLMASKVQLFEVAADQIGEDQQQDQPILASSHDADQPDPADSPANASDAEFERRASEELTREDPPNGNADAKQ